MERQSWWSDKPVVHLVRRVGRAQATPDDPGFTPLQRVQAVFADWTPSNQAAHEESVEVYSNCEEVELFLNGKSLGSKGLPADASARVWPVPFDAGTLRAVGKNHGREVAAEELRTAGCEDRAVDGSRKAVAGVE
jgi:beta-galactosidase